MEDRQIIDLYFARDEQAVAETAKKYGPYCTSISMDILRNRQDAEECVNDTWNAAWHCIPPDVPQCLSAYLGRIVRRISISRYRYLHAAVRNRDLETAFEELEGCIVTPGDTDYTHNIQLKNDINDFLGSQTHKARVIFILRYYHAKPLRDIAAALGMTEKAVSKHLVRTRERLRKYLNERGYRI